MTKTLSVDHLAEKLYANASQSPVDREKLRIDMGNGILLRAQWFDHNNLLAGVIVTPNDMFPLLDQLLGTFKNGKWVDFQTTEQACEALAKNAIQMIQKLTQAA